ncbi:MAG: M28 family metallopeptidase [Acidobacteriota bacterium]
MKLFIRLLGVVLIAGVTASPAAQTPSPMMWDEAFRALPQTANIRSSMQRMSARPHHVGSAYGKDNAEWILARFKEWGWNAEIERFDVLFPTPRERRLELIEPTRFTARLEEPAVPGDPTSGQKAEQLPSYNAYSIDGDVTAPLVYVNYGRAEDYELLDRLGITVRGAIVIARYGQSWRGIKPKLAAEHGAVGCLIYSDPRDDGYAMGPVFPNGPMRPGDGVQRGSVMDLPVYPGDPLTPGIGATPGARRLPLSEATALTKIPVLPISYADAQPLLAAIAGVIAPETWRGSLPITYRIGPGPARVHLKVAFQWDQQPLYNVIAKIPGSTFPDEWIIRGNHHDAWVNGAADPASGMSAELEEARALGELRKQGWSPKRTIVYAAWDGEEPGLLGSTEWVETHADDLRDHAVVYINTDGNGRGFLSAGGSHSLERFINGVARDVTDPETGVSVWKRRQARLIARGTAEARKSARDRADLRIDALGSGSDYSPFLQHAGIASLNLGFDEADEDGIYHSIYDDFYFFTRFLDTDFVYGRALAQTVGTAVIRLADSDVLPIEFTNLADTVEQYVKELTDLLKQKQGDSREHNRQVQDGVFAAVADPRLPQVAPQLERVPPAINFAPLENASVALTDSARRYDRALGSARTAMTGNAARALNARLRSAERQLTDTAGLPNRPWYRHLLYAPGLHTGYSVKTMPGVRESIEQRRYAEVEGEVARVSSALLRLVEVVDSAAADLERIGRP